jgi:hypothetical protein
MPKPNTVTYETPTTSPEEHLERIIAAEARVLEAEKALLALKEQAALAKDELKAAQVGLREEISDGTGRLFKPAGE